MCEFCPKDGGPCNMCGHGVPTPDPVLHPYLYAGHHGRIVAQAGGTLDDSPYPRGSREHQFFGGGFIDAKDKQ